MLENVRVDHLIRASNFLAANLALNIFMTPAAVRMIVAPIADINRICVFISLISRSLPLGELIDTEKEGLVNVKVSGRVVQIGVSHLDESGANNLVPAMLDQVQQRVICVVSTVTP